MKSLRSLALCYLALGVPILLGMWLMGDEESRAVSSAHSLYLRLIILGLISLFLIVFIFHWGSSLQNKVHLAYYVYFAVVGFFTLSGLIYQAASVIKEQIIGLATLFIWTSTLITVYFLVKSLAEYRRAMRLIDIAGVVIGLSVILAFFGPQYFGFEFGEFHSEGGEIRAFGPFGDQVGFALVYFALRTIVKGRLLFFPLFGSAILLTGTVGAYISFGVGMLWLLLLSAGLGKMAAGLQRRLLFLTTVCIILILGFLSAEFGSTAVSRIQATGQGEGSMPQRLLSMTLGLRVFIDNPLGVGYLGFSRMGDKYAFYNTFGEEMDVATYTTGNQFLQTALDGGFFALCALVAFLFILYRTLRVGTAHAGRDMRADLVAGLAWLVAIAVGNQSAVWLLPTAITSQLFFLVFGLLLRAVSLQPRTARPIPEGNPARARAKA